MVIEHFAHSTHIIIYRSGAENRIIQFRTKQLVHLVDNTIVGYGNIIVAVCLFNNVVLRDVKEFEGIVLHRRERAGHGLCQIGLHHIVQNAGEDRWVIVINSVKVCIEVFCRNAQRRVTEVLEDISSLLQEVVLHSLVIRCQESSNLGIIISRSAFQCRIIVVPSWVKVQQLVVSHRHTTYRLRQLGALRVLTHIADGKNGILTA